MRERRGCRWQQGPCADGLQLLHCSSGPPAPASAKDACLCNAGFRGAPGEKCINPNASAPTMPSTTPVAAPVPVGAALVVVQVRLPMTAMQFRCECFEGGVVLMQCRGGARGVGRHVFVR